MKELCEFIWYLEEKYDLLLFEIDGVKIWQHSRVKLYFKLAKISGVFSQPHDSLSRFQKIKNLLGYIKNSFINNYFTLKQNDIVVLSHPRVVNIDGEYIDIYTKYFIDELIQSGQKVVEFESAYLGKHYKKRTECIHYTDWIELLQRFEQLFIKVILTNEQKNTINKIEDEIKTVFGVDFLLSEFLINHLKSFKSIHRIYNRIFQVVNPKHIYMLVSYFKAPIIKAAKDNNIQVIELQHGTFGKYHLGYSFPNDVNSLNYFPDKFYVWNDFWKGMMKLPITEKNIIVDSFRYLSVQKEKYNHLKKKNHLVILSQGSIGEQIAEKFLEHFEKFKDYKIMYKLHPGEFSRWKSYKSLQKLNEFKNVLIIKDEIPLYELLAMSVLQIGVYSTALYEGVEFGCKTILLDVNGIENMDRFIQVYDDIQILE